MHLIVPCTHSIGGLRVLEGSWCLGFRTRSNLSSYPAKTRLTFGRIVAVVDVPPKHCSFRHTAAELKARILQSHVSRMMGAGCAKNYPNPNTDNLLPKPGTLLKTPKNSTICAAWGSRRSGVQPRNPRPEAPNFCPKACNLVSI